MQDDTSSVKLFQVNAVNIALTTLNTQILTCLEDKSEGISSRITLREIMQRQNKLHDICSTLNEAYGYSLLFVTLAAFIDATLCVAVPLKYNPLEDVVIGVLWAALGNLPLMLVMQICQRTLTKVRQLLRETRERDNKLLSFKIRSQFFETLRKT